MNYFDDLSLVGGNEYPRCRVCIDRRFETVCSLQLSLGGPLFFSVDRGAPVLTDKPLVFWHHPAHTYQYHARKKDSWHHLWISFRGPRARRLLEQGFLMLKPEGCFAPRDTGWVAETMRELIRLSRNPGRERAALLLEETLLWAREEVEAESLDRPDSLQKVRQIAERLRRRPDRHFNFPRAVAGAGLSLSHFRALFHQVTGSAPYAFLLRQLMERAASELAGTRLGIGQIGLRAGYADPAQFSKAFKKELGYSPEAFRNGVPRGKFGPG